MAHVCIPDYAGPQVVAGARCLFRDGDRVSLLTWSKGRSVGGLRSRAFARVISAPSPRVDASGYLGAVRVMHDADPFDAVIPFGLQASQALTHDPERILRPLPTMLPSPAVFDRLNNKTNLVRVAAEIGIETPRVYEAAATDDLNAVARDARFPLVVKVASGSGVAEGLRYANSADELRHAWHALRQRAAATNGEPRELLVQEYIPGRIHDACTFTVHGRPMQIVTQVRQLMYPIYGGVGAINITTDDAILRRLAASILEHAGYHGTAQIEFKLDSRDGRYKLIEFNPKLWGTLNLSIKAGVPFPAMVRDHLLGRAILEQRPYIVGARYNFWFPLAVLAKVQLWREFGARGLGGVPRGRCNFHDIEPRDLRPDIHRLLSTVRTLVSNRLLDVNRNIPRELIPVPWGD